MAEVIENMKDWLTVKEAEDSIGERASGFGKVTDQRIRRMIENNLVGRIFNDGVHRVHVDDLPIVIKIADYINSNRGSGSYEGAREMLLKENLLVEYQREEEISTTEIAVQNVVEKVVLDLIKAQQQNQAELIENVVNRVVDQLSGRFDKIVEEHIEQRLDTLLEGSKTLKNDLLEVRNELIAHSESELKKVVKEQEEKLKRQSDKLIELVSDREEIKNSLSDVNESLSELTKSQMNTKPAPSENARENALKTQQALIRKLEDENKLNSTQLNNLTNEINELKQQLKENETKAKRKKFFGLF